MHPPIHALTWASDTHTHHSFTRNGVNKNSSSSLEHIDHRRARHLWQQQCTMRCVQQQHPHVLHIATKFVCARTVGVTNNNAVVPLQVGNGAELLESWRIRLTDLKFIRKIANGNVGVVYEGRYRERRVQRQRPSSHAAAVHLTSLLVLCANSGVQVAIKKLLGNWYKNKDMVERFREEIVLMSQMDHPNGAAAAPLHTSHNQPARKLQLILGCILCCLCPRLSPSPLQCYDSWAL